MKKLIFIGLMMITGFVNAQGEPQLEAVGELVKATYYYENGNVQQEGFFKDGKLEGKWTSYSENGIVKSVAEYSNGEKTGKWLYFDNAVASSEVNYSNNKVVAIKKLNQNALAKN